MPPVNLNSARIAQQPRMGQASTSADGSYTYEPKAGFTGKDQFAVELKVQEIRSAKMDTKTVIVNVEVKPPSGKSSGCLRERVDLPPGADGVIRLRIIPGMSCDLWNNPNVSRSNVTLTTQPRQGSVASSSVGIVYQANASARGSDRFDVLVESIYAAKARRVSVEVTFVDVL